jgi:methyl-accepting chemotaxis protein
MHRIFPIHLPIAAKTVLLIGMLGILSVAANLYFLGSLHRIDDENARITQQIEPVRLLLTESKIAVGWIGLATYKMAASTDPDTVREANNERAGQLAAARTWLNSIAASLPNHRNEIEGMLKRLRVVNEIASAVNDLREAGDIAQARFALEFKFEPALVDAHTSMNRLIDILGGQNKEALGAMAENKAWTYRLFTGVSVGGTILTVLLAMLLAHAWVASPLRQLADCSQKIADGHLTQPIGGLERGDEVGTMARAVRVFRDNSITLREAQQQRQRAREQAAAEKREALDRLAHSFESKVLNVAAALAASAAQLEDSAHSMSMAADDSERSARGAAVVAEKSTKAAMTVASAVEKLSATMHDIKL